MKKIIFALLVVCSFSASANNMQKLDDLMQPVFDAIEGGRFNKLVSTAMSQSSIVQYMSKFDLEESDRDFKSYFSAFGTYYSHRVLYEQGIEGDFWARWYLLKFQRQPVVLYVEFYKPDDHWEVNSISIKTDIDDGIEEAGDEAISLLGQN